MFVEKCLYFFIHCCEVTMKCMLQSIVIIFASHLSKQMKWTGEHDSIFVRELFLFEQWNYKYGSKKRGNFQKRISESLDQLTDMNFKLTQKTVQDPYQTLGKSYQKQKREEDRASGISLEETEVDVALADTIERFKESQKINQGASEKQKKKAERNKSRRHAKRVVRVLW